MTSTLDIITDAYRESNITGLGVVPNEPQQTEGLRLLKSVVSSVYGFEVGEGLKDWPIGKVNVDDPSADWAPDIWTRPLANSRLLWTSDSAQTVILPNGISDGARIAVIDVLGNMAQHNLTLDGNGRRVAGATQLVLDGSEEQVMLLYRADMAEWVRVDPIADITAAFPFPPEFDTYFVTRLAMRLNPRYGRSLASESVTELQRSLSQLKARYRQRVVVGASLGVLTQTPKGFSPWVHRGVPVPRIRGWEGS